MTYDITLCEGKDCPLKENCLRNILNEQVGLDFQSYFLNPPYKGCKCDFFIEKKPSKEG